jgi:signal transduction histidine kinase
MASGRTVFEFARVDVRALVEQAIDANTGFAAGHNATLRLDAGVAAADVRADTGRLDQVLTNLISNAIKFSPPGGEVVVGIEARGGRCRVTVRDHGPGVPDHFRSRIFERFSQAEIADGRQKGGTGLGLSIVKQIVARLGGEAGFEDAAGGGTIFWVEVPFWEDPAAEARSPDEEPRMIPMAASA